MLQADERRSLVGRPQYEIKPKYGEWRTTGVVERRGANHKLHVECVCGCGVRKFVRADKLEDGGSSSCGCGIKASTQVQASQRRTGRFYVRAIGGALTRWAQGAPDAPNPWLQDEREPPPDVPARSREEAEEWIKVREAWRASQGRPRSRYYIVER